MAEYEEKPYKRMSHRPGTRAGNGKCSVSGCQSEPTISVPGPPPGANFDPEWLAACDEHLEEVRAM